MRDRWLWKTLILPLGLGSLGLVGLHSVLPLGGLWVNLAASFLTIIVTVLYVDRTLEHRDRMRWAGPSKLLSARLGVLSASTITNLRGPLGFRPPRITVVDVLAMQREYLSHCQTTIEPGVIASLQGLDVAGWKKLADGLQTAYVNVQNDLSLFGNRFNPRELELVMALQNHLLSALLPYETFPDLLGVPNHLLPKGNADTVFLKDFHTNLVASEIRATLKTCRELGQYELEKEEAAA